MRIINATMPRSGSEFVSKLVRKVCGARVTETMSLTPARKINHFSSDVGRKNPGQMAYRDWIEANDSVSFFDGYQDVLIKIESPGNDLLCLDLAGCLDDLKWVFSIRKPEQIITSHYNIKKWGWTEERVLNAYKSDLVVYEYLARGKGIFGIDVNDPSSFDLDALVRFLEMDSITPEAEEFVRSWAVVNPLSQQRERSGEKGEEVVMPPDIDSLRKRRPWVSDVESRMKAIADSGRTRHK